MLARRPLVALLALAGCVSDTGAATTTATTGAATTSDPASTSSSDDGAAQPTSTAADGSTTSTTLATDSNASDDTTTGAPLDLECTTPPCFNVINRCSMPLWIRVANQDGELAPANAQLAPGESQQYAVPPSGPPGASTPSGSRPTTTPRPTTRSRSPSPAAR